MISEIYKLTRNKHDYGIEGYTVAKTCNYATRESKFPNAKRKDLTYEAQVHAKEPDPTKYNITYEKSIERYWTKPNGKFLKSKKKSVMEEISQRARSTPGPGAYGQDQKSPPKHTRGAFR